MKKKFQSINTNFYPVLVFISIILLWQFLCTYKIVPPFMLPSPLDVGRALVNEFPLLLSHAKVTLTQAFIGIFLSIIFSILIAITMDQWEVCQKSLKPLIILSQTIPSIAIGPILVLWFGYGMTPKIILIFTYCFFPLVINIYDGLKSVDTDMVRLFKTMGAGNIKILLWVKIPFAINYFFIGLKVAVSFAIVGSVIAEWLGGNSGLGVYMTRVRKSYAFDKMFAVILFISCLTLLLLFLVELLHKKITPWEQKKLV